MNMTFLNATNRENSLTCVDLYCESLSRCVRAMLAGQ